MILNFILKGDTYSRHIKWLFLYIYKYLIYFFNIYIYFYSQCKVYHAPSTLRFTPNYDNYCLHFPNLSFHIAPSIKIHCHHLDTAHSLDTSLFEIAILLVIYWSYFKLYIQHMNSACFNYPNSTIKDLKRYYRPFLVQFSERNTSKSPTHTSCVSNKVSSSHHEDVIPCLLYLDLTLILWHRICYHLLTYIKLYL